MSAIEWPLLASKVATQLVMPAGIVALLLGLSLAAGALRRSRAAWILGFAALALYWIAATPAVANWLLWTLESRHPPATLAEARPLEAAIVLGGAVLAPEGARRHVGVTRASDRVLLAARLHRAGKIRLIVVSGGNLNRDPDPARRAPPEAEHIRDLLIEWGVPPEAILIEGQSRTTHENAVETRRLLGARRLGQAYLVTSAAHMPRALAEFRRAGLDVVPFAADVRSTRPSAPELLDWLPSASALQQSGEVIKEWIGIMVHHWRGWI